jgi:hypothetical protein
VHIATEAPIDELVIHRHLPEVALQFLIAKCF